MNRYQRAREMAGFTQRELANLIGVKPAVVSRYEDESDNRIVPPLNRIQAIAKVCGVPVSFLTDPKRLYMLDDEQAKRFREEISAYNDSLKHWPEETESAYGTKHPFLYMLKDRWEPAIEDVEYVERKFGIKGKYIINKYVVNRAEADRQIEENDRQTVSEKKTYSTPSKIFQYFLEQNDTVVTYSDANALSMDGIIVIESDQGLELYLNISNVDFDIIESVITIVNKNRRKEQEMHEFEAMVENGVDIKKPPQDQEDPEAE